MKSGILFIPSTRTGNGTGHIKRCAALVQASGGFLLLRLGPGNFKKDFLLSIINPAECSVIWHNDDDKMPESSWNFIVLDNRDTPPAFMRMLLSNAPVFAIDEGGPARQTADWLIDTHRFPSAGKFHANINAPGIPVLPENRNDCISKPATEPEILVTFGGEDPAGLTEKVYRFFVRQQSRIHTPVTVLRPLRLSDQLEDTKLVSVCDPVDNLPCRMREFSLVLTSFGLTAWEAVRNNIPVLLVNPSPLHARLGRLNGFTNAGNGRRLQGKKLLTCLKTPARNMRLLSTVKLNRTGLSIHDFIGATRPGASCCPVCHSFRRKPVFRSPARTFFNCTECSMVYQVRRTASSLEYNHDYFFDAYAKQYGKTYLDDFEHIEMLARERIKVLGSLLKTTPAELRLLDIGCAYGPFLKAARQTGFTVEGLEINQEAADYLQNSLKIPVVCAPFESFQGDTLYSVISLWFVIEHFKDLDPILQKLGNLIASGGWLILSTPNGKGFTARFRKEKFFTESPEDHFTVWNPQIARKVLARYGFRVKRIRVTGIHSERIPFLRFLGYFLPRPLVQLIGRLLKLGDTFEVYAQRQRGLV